MRRLQKIKGSIYKIINDSLVKERQKSIDKRIKQKKKEGNKRNVVFVCHRPAVWGALKSVFEAFEADNNYNVTIVAIPNKKEDDEKYFSHEEYVSEGAESFFGLNYANVINGYDYSSKIWFNLRNLEPDYVFFQTPYNICRPVEYRSHEIAMYAKICYVHYGFGNMDFPSLGTSPVDFMRYVSFLFPDTREKEVFWNKLLNRNSLIKNRVSAYCGYPKFDEYFILKENFDDPWKYKGENRKKLRVLWTPRWTEEEGNSCWMDYKELFLDYAFYNPDVEIWFRPHPQMKNNMQGDDEWKAYLQKAEKIDNFYIDFRDEYFDTFLYSDLLISDVSGMLAEYMPTGNPIILCVKKLNFNQTGEKLSASYYFAYTWKDVQSHIRKIKCEEDTLKEIRKKLISEELIVDSRQKAGVKIKEIIDNAY